MEGDTLGKLVKKKEITTENGSVKITGMYCPTLEHSERFVDITEDDNPLHKAHPVYGEAISPGFMQTSTSILLIKEAMREAGLNPADYNFSINNSEMGARGAIVTGGEYPFEVESSPKGELMESSVVMKNNKGAVLYNFKRESYVGPEGFDGQVFSTPVHESRFTSERSATEFGKLIGSESSEGNLFGISCSSYVVFDAIRSGSISPVQDGLIVLYSSQNIYSDATKTPNLKNGINLELHLSDPEKFGGQLERNQSLDMRIAARDDDGRIIYVSQSPISFQREKLWDIMMRRAGLKPKDLTPKD